MRSAISIPIPTDSYDEYDVVDDDYEHDEPDQNGPSPQEHSGPPTTFEDLHLVPIAEPKDINLESKANRAHVDQSTARQQSSVGMIGIF